MVRDQPNPVLGDGVDDVAEENGTSEHHPCGARWRQQFKREIVATEPRGGTSIGKAGISCQVLGRRSQGKAPAVRAISHQACALSLGVSGATCLAGTFSFHWKVKCTKAERKPGATPVLGDRPRGPDSVSQSRYINVGSRFPTPAIYLPLKRRHLGTSVNAR